MNRKFSESSSDGTEDPVPRKRFRTGSFYSERDESEEEPETPVPTFGFGHQRSSSSSSSFGSPTGPSGVGFGSPTGSSAMGFGSPTGSSAFAYPSVVAKSTPASGNLKESPSDSDDKATDSYVIPAQVTKPQYSEAASKMMAKMGYKEGTGLGKHGQGRVNIVEASKQRGQRGLGLVLKSFEPADVQWDFDKEQVTTDERVDWMPNCRNELPPIDTMRTWIKIGPKQEHVDEDIEFCSEKTLLDVLKCKSVFDDLESEEMRRARTRSNPFETIRGAFFQNRAAMKMANMDAVLDFMFTDPKHPNGAPVVGPNELLYFADVCAGPGGFSEYVLWRKKWECKGFGFTLKGPCDFKLGEFFAAYSELFEPHYGVGGLEGDGDVYRPDNLMEFRRFVLENTDGLGVHFMMADGGFDVEGKENFQEVLSKRLYLCQFLCALSILRPGGHFVCKLFDIFTVYSVGLIYLMWHAFDHVSIFKPVTSRPANSERYIVCKWKKPNTEPLREYLFEVNVQYSKLGGILSKEDINEVVPLPVLKSSAEFSNYIIESNERLGKLQCVNLVKIQTFTKNAELYEHRQAEIRQTCLKRWKVPDQVRTRPDSSVGGAQKFKQLLKETDMSYFAEEPTKLTAVNLADIHSIYDYKCYISGSKDGQWILLGQGKSNVWKWNGQSSNRWAKQDAVKMELPRDTVLKAEFVMELRGEGKGQRKVMAAHVTDALFLCGTDVRDLHYNERMEKARKFVKAITRNTRSDLAPIRVKEIYRFEDMQQILNKLAMKLVKGQGQHPRLCYGLDNERCIMPWGVHFVKIVQDPYMMAFSRSQSRKYFFNTLTKEAVFHTPKEAIATFKGSCKGSIFWSWEEGVQIHPSQTKHNPSHVSAQHMVGYINEKIRPNR